LRNTDIEAVERNSVSLIMLLAVRQKNIVSKKIDIPWKMTNRIAIKIILGLKDGKRHFLRNRKPLQAFCDYQNKNGE
jgi:hypothetical protein